MLNSTHLKNLAISSSGFVFDPRSGATFTLNPTGLAIVLALRDGEGVDAVVEGLKNKFEGVGSSTRDDVLDFIQSLRVHGLVPVERTT